MVINKSRLLIKLRKDLKKEIKVLDQEKVHLKLKFYLKIKL